MKLKFVGLGLAALAVGAGLVWWWNHDRIYPATSDAYLHANVLAISPQVGGKVSSVAVSENERVSADDLLFAIEPQSFQAALDIAQAQLDLASQSADAGGSNVNMAEAQLSETTASLRKAESDYDRTKGLFAQGDVAQAALDQATAARDQAKAAVNAAAAAVSSARDQLGAGGEKNAGVQAALGRLTLARLDLDHATVRAPAAGWIANLSLRPGQMVAPNQPLFSLVEDGAWWVDANFKETDIDRIRPGQPVALSIDMYPGVKLTGRVESIGAGSGAVFSLLPPQNATGNWVKVTQRFPVRIAVDPLPAGSPVQLRVGASVTATIDTTSLGAR